MPMFEFKCSKCGHEFEELVFSTTPYCVRCPNCSSLDVDKKISAFSSGGASGSGPSCNTFG